MIQCPNCNSTIDDTGAAFCPNCGTPLAQQPAQPVQPEQLPPQEDLPFFLSRLIDFTIAATMRTTTSNTIIVPMFCESQVSITISPFDLDNS